MSNQVERSALWSAYGDALGFITESRGRFPSDKPPARVEDIGAWSRRVGGRFGAQVRLPPGAYSDDTQLRIATARSIRGDGVFDVETFSKIELPVWLAYELGGGRGSKAAASALSKNESTWFNNFFETRGVTYLQSGGNGAAMRIQPHVWSAEPRAATTDLVRQVVRNAVCTHGHFRGILGAVLHALVLRATLMRSAVPDPSEWPEFIKRLEVTVDAIRSDAELNDFWCSQWEAKMGTGIEQACSETIGECRTDMQALLAPSKGDRESRYRHVLQSVGGTNPSTRGSGTKSALIALFVAWSFRDDPMHAMVAAANVLNSDTDTIATLAGAMLGAVTEDDPPADVQDHEYIRSSAYRMWRVSSGASVENFGYPDILKWRTPRSSLDVVGQLDGSMVISGLGEAKSIRGPVDTKGRNPTLLQWIVTHYGQSMLVRRRQTLRSLDRTQIPRRPEEVVVARRKSTISNQQTSLLDARELQAQERLQERSIDRLVAEIVESNFDSALIGKLLLEVSDGQHAAERAAALAALITREYRQRG